MNSSSHLIGPYIPRLSQFSAVWGLALLNCSRKDIFDLPNSKILNCSGQHPLVESFKEILRHYISAGESSRKKRGGSVSVLYHNEDQEKVSIV